MDFEKLSEYLVYIVFIISKLVKNSILQIIIVIGIFAFCNFFIFFLSQNAVNTRFEKDYYNMLSQDSVLKNVIDKKQLVFYGDTPIPSIFFTEIAKANLGMLEKYKNNIKFIRLTINHKPSTSLQIAENIEENNLILKNTNSKDKELRTFLEYQRRDMFLVQNPQTINIPIYWEKPISKKNFSENLQQYPNQIIPIYTKKELIKNHWKGQVIFVQHTQTGHTLVFREMNGDQSQHLLNSKKTKFLLHYVINSLKELQIIDNELYQLITTFNLNSLITTQGRNFQKEIYLNRIRHHIN